MPSGKILKLRLFMEGIEVPIVSANLSIQSNAPSQCQIQIPATDKALELCARTLVHVFYRDLNDDVEGLQQVVSGIDQVETIESELDRQNSEYENSSTNSSEPVVTESTASRDNEQIPSINTTSTLSSDQVNNIVSRVNTPRTEDEIYEDIIEHRIWLSDIRWKLYFCGEVVGYQYVKAYGQRAIILQCLDLSNYWDTCYQYKVNSSSLTGDGLANFIAAGTDLFDEFYEGSESIIAQILNSKSKTRPELTGLLSGVVHLLERVGGVFRDGGFKGVNDFFSIAELRLHLIDMLTACERDNTSQQYVAARLYNRFLCECSGQLSQIASFREILNLMNKFMFHEVYPCPIAKFESSTERQETTRRRVTSTSDDPALRSILISAKSIVAASETLITQLIGANIRIVDLNAQKRQNPSLAIALDPVITVTHNEVDMYYRTLDSNCAVLRDMSLRGQEIAERSTNRQVSYVFNAAAAYFRLAGENFSERRASNAIRLYVGGVDYLDKASEGIGVERVGTRVRTQQRGTPARLNSQIIRPDIWMCSPPRCNVIFPELFNNISFARQFLTEVTRLRLTVTDEIFGHDELLNQFYYAPDVAVIGARSQQMRANRAADRTLSQAAFAKRLMDHELFTGVIPSFERLNEINIYAARTDPISQRGVEVPTVTRAAHFQFFKQRYVQRSITVNGIFNPNAVAGFPALIVDRYMNADQLASSNLRGLDLSSYLNSNFDQLETVDVNGQLSTVLQELSVTGSSMPSEGLANNISAASDLWAALRVAVPTQFIGMIVGLQHSVSHDSASTSYSLIYGRTHRDNEELLGSNEETINRRNSGTTTWSGPIAALADNPPRIGQMGPNYGEITSVIQSTRTGRFILFGTFRPNVLRGLNARTRREVRVPVGQNLPLSDYPAEVTRIVGSNDPNTTVTFTAYEITEEVNRRTNETVSIPFEDFVRPSWISDVWRNSRIGATYNQILGTGALVDDLIVDTNGRGTTSASAINLENISDMADADIITSSDWLQTDGITVQESEQDIDVEKAVDLLIRTYSGIKHNNMDANEFVRAYTFRPIATLLDMLGSRDLQIDPSTGEAIQGTKGLHSLAFGHGEMGRNLRNLVGSTARRILGIDANNDRANTLSRLDKRAEKAEKVMNYVAQLYDSRGQLG